METVFDVIVLGLGAMGSASSCHLARAGKRVLGLDRFLPPCLGSSHGQTRIIRGAYIATSAYVPVQRAYDLWHELEAKRDDSFPSNRRTNDGQTRGKRRHLVLAQRGRTGLRHEIFSADEVKRRFPALTPHEEMIAV